MPKFNKKSKVYMKKFTILLLLLVGGEIFFVHKIQKVKTLLA